MADNFITNVAELSSANKRVIQANAEAQGVTPEEYLASRGGVNPVTGKYGDSVTPYDLTEEEYVAARRAGGGQAINEATAKKNYDRLIGLGKTPEEAAALSGYVPAGVTPTGKTSGGGGGTAALSNYAASQQASAQAAADKAARQSAYDMLYQQFSQYGLGSLVEDIKGLIQDAKASPSEFAIALQNTDAYKKRFAANQERIKQGLRALTPAEYIGLEDQYQNIMRNYGLPASYYAKDSMGTQEGLNKFIANDVSAAELEDRIATAQQRVINADVNTKDALRKFYPDITDGDILAYTLDPTNALQNIKRKVTAAEIGGAALGQGLMTSAASAEDLAKYGITKAQAQAGYQQIGEFLPTATQLGAIYANQGVGPYDQLTAEQEVFGTAGAAEAARKRRKLSELERAAFSGSAGTSGGALNRDRAGAYQGYREPGAGAF